MTLIATKTGIDAAEKAQRLGRIESIESVPSPVGYPESRVNAAPGAILRSNLIHPYDGKVVKLDTGSPGAPLAGTHQTQILTL
ncbi:hypothetical protein Trydic_g3290 [Trypoxylus dichotomus]